MNNITLAGRLATEPELTNNEKQTTCCKFTIAVDKETREADGKRGAYFFQCAAWRETASFIFKHFKKGQPIILQGSLQENRWTTPEGHKKAVTYICINKAEFIGWAPQKPAEGETGTENA